MKDTLSIPLSLSEISIFIVSYYRQNFISRKFLAFWFVENSSQPHIIEIKLFIA